MRWHRLWLIVILIFSMCQIGLLPTLAQTADTSVRLTDHYRLTSQILDSYFQNDSDGIIAVLSQQQAKLVPTPESATERIDNANYWLATARFFRLLGDRTRHENSLKNARQAARSLTQAKDRELILAHGALESAEAEILFGAPVTAQRHLNEVSATLIRQSLQIAARAASARAAVRLLLLDRRGALAASAEAVELFAKVGANEAEAMVARVRQLAAMDRVETPGAHQELEKFVADFVTTAPAKPMLFAEIFHTVGIMPFGESQAAQTANIFRQILKNAQLEETHPLAISAQLALIGSDLLVGRNGDALRKGFAFLQSFGSHQPPPSTMLADLYMQIAGSLSIQGEVDNSEKFANTALQISQQVTPKDSPFHRLKLVDGAEIKGRLQQRENALALLAQAKIEALGDQSGLGDALIKVKAASIYESVGDDRSAEHLYKLAYNSLPPDALDTITNFAVVEPYSAAMYRYGQAKESLSATRRAVQMLRNIVARETGMLGELQFDPVHSQRIRTFRSGNASVINRLLNLLTELPNRELTSAIRNEAFVAAQFANGSKIEDTLSKVAQRESTQSEVLSDLLRRQQDLSSQLAKASGELSYYQAGLSSEEKPELFIDNIQSNLSDLKGKLLEVERRVRSLFPKTSSAISLPILKIEEVTKQLRPDEAVLYYHQTSSKTLLWTISRDGDSLASLAVAPNDVLARVNAIRSSLDATSVTRSFDSEPESGADRIAPFDRQNAYSLYRDLLKPVWDQLRDKKVLYIGTNGALTALPFSLFVTSPPQGNDDSPDDLRATSWLVNSHATVTLPSLSYLKVFASTDIDSKRVKSQEVRLAAFGNPRFSASHIPQSNEQRGALIGALHKMAPLPNTKRELTAMAAILNAPGDSLYLGERATETNVKQADLTDANVLAFATHALLSSEIAGLSEPGIVLSPPGKGSDLDDGLLTATELSLLRINADWLIFSACNTAGSDGSANGEGLSGLASAGLYAGAKSLLVSHWPVLDNAAADLTTSTLRTYYDGGGTNPAEALRQAMLQLLSNTKQNQYAHPAAWAPFVLVGGLQR